MKEKTTDTEPVLDFGALPYATHARLTVPVTILKGKNPRPLRHITLSELLAEIETTHIAPLNHAKAMVIAYEQYLQNVEKGIEYPKKGYETKKDQLYGFQLGHFSYRNDEKESCLEYVPCQVFDLDGCQSTYDVFLFREKLKELAYVFAAFASPSGYGLRILIWTNATYDTHIAIYLQILEKLCTHLGVTTDKRNGTHFDTTCKNQSRHFYYVAIDPKSFYLNLESQTLEIQIAAPVIPEKSLPPIEKKVIMLSKVTASDSYTYIDALNDEVKIEYLLKNIDMNKPRKIQCFYFGCVCRENNVDFEAARRTAVHRFYDSEQKNPEKVIEAQLKDGYNYSQVRYDDAQFIAFLRNTHNVIIKSNKTPIEVTPTNTPVENRAEKLELETKYPSAAFYARLPKLLKQCTDALTHEMDKHVFLWGAFPAISSLCSDVSGIYDKKKVFASYYTYIVATGGAGKGALDYARQLVLGLVTESENLNKFGQTCTFRA
jgi:VirE N-terminal domain